MESVMMNQLPELVIPKNRSFAPVQNMTVAGANPDKRTPYLRKWYVLFDNRCDQWISFQPQIGYTVYPCYACRDMFGSKNSFLDHVNRRGLVLEYKCLPCKKTLTFYNTCSFLLHARDHFSISGGSIDLDNVEISAISMDIAGFLPIPNIPRLYDTPDDVIHYGLKMNVKYYKPNEECVGKRIVFFIPIDFLFYCNAKQKEIQTMVLCQVNSHIPRCIFMEMNKIQNVTNGSSIRQSISDTDLDSDRNSHESDDDVICMDDEIQTSEKTKPPEEPRIQVRDLNSLVKKSFMTLSNSDEERSLAKASKLIEKPHCPECNESVSKPMRIHFQKFNRPLDDAIKCGKCGLLSPTACSFKAHIRIHDKRAPFICPECGKVFDKWEQLNSHMDDVCFHLAKTVRYKCPAKKCGKVFAQTITFTSHFPLAHMKVRFACNSCPLYFINETEYMQHASEHENSTATIRKIHECLVCSVPVYNLREHVGEHIQHVDNRIYVYICKYCRSYYRSTQTYASHLLRCTKLLLNSQVKKEVEAKGLTPKTLSPGSKCIVVRHCKPCSSKIQFHCSAQEIQTLATRCPQCSTPFVDISDASNSSEDYEFTGNDLVRKDVETNKFICILCNETLSSDDMGDSKKHACKYQNPIVAIDSNKSDNSMEGSDALVSPGNEETKKKRKRFSNGSSKNKKVHTTEPNPESMLTADPILFDGEYKCGLCSFKNESRTVFHDHIQEHRDVSTAYQCMECGECFVVKPSLLKHLQVYHLVEDVESYMNENECFDKQAVKALEENMRMIPGEPKEPVAENQCRICRQVFSDEQELSKHFRVHGMAFLMKKIIK